MQLQGEPLYEESTPLQSGLEEFFIILYPCLSKK